MNLLPQPSGNRPRLACEISPQGVVAARTDPGVATLAAVARVSLAAGAVTPSLRPGNIADRVAVTAAVRKALDTLGLRPNTRGADLTLVVPDAAVRVLLLEFDSLPNKLSEALPIVRFRLKKMLPFEADDAMISYQVMSTSKQMLRVLAVAIPRDVLSEYETAAREAGFEPGAILPSTLACCAGMDDADGAALLVNANPAGVTTAIVRAGILLLHRSVDLQPAPAALPANLPPALFEGTSPHTSLPLVDVEASQGEWAAQEALPEHGRNPYADRMAAEIAVQDEDGITAIPVPHVFNGANGSSAATHSNNGTFAPLSDEEAAPMARSPYASRALTDDLNAELHNAILIAPTSLRDFAEEVSTAPLHAAVSATLAAQIALRPASAVPQSSPQSALDRDIAEAVNVAAAYFEDTLAQVPTRILCAGPLGAETLQAILLHRGVAQTDGLQVREVVSTDALLPGAVSASVPRGWLAGVVGALKT